MTILLSYFRDEWNISLKFLKYLFVRKSGSQIHWFFNMIILQFITHDCITWKYNNFVNNMTYKYLSLFSKPRIKYCVFLFLNRNIAPVPLAKGYFKLKNKPWLVSSFVFKSHHKLSKILHRVTWYLHVQLSNQNILCFFPPKEHVYIYSTHSNWMIFFPFMLQSFLPASPEYPDTWIL